MPQPNQRASLIPYHLRSFLGGMSDYEDKGIAGSFKSGYGLDIRKQIDSLSGQLALKDDLALGTITGTPYFVVPASDGQTYIFCNDGKIFRRKSNGSYLVQGYGNIPVWTETFESGNIVGACEWFSQSGYTYLLWATPTRLNIKKIAGPNYTPAEPWTDVNVADTGSWPKTNLTSQTNLTSLLNDPTLRAYFQLEDTTDSGPNGYDLTNTNSVAFNPGNFGNAADFGASNSNKQLSQSSSLGLTNSSDFTIACWVKLESEIASGIYNIFNIQFPSSLYAQLYYSYNSGTRQLVLDFGGSSGGTYNITLGTSSFYHLAMVKSGTSLKLYVNNVLRATATTGSTGGLGVANFDIGSGGGVNYLQGLIDDFVVFARVLNATELGQIFGNSLISAPQNISASSLNPIWHTMCIANGVLQICNGNVMALVGYDLSYTNNSLALIPGNLSICVLERGKYGIIGCRATNNKDESNLFAWDGIGLSWNDKQNIKFGGLNTMLDGEIALAQIGTKGQLYVSDFNTPMPFRQIRGGGQADIDGITSHNGLILIGIYNNTNLINGHFANGIYSIGRVNKNAPIVLNLEYQLDCDEITSVKTIGTDVIVVYKLNGQYGVKIVDTGTASDWVYQSLDLVAPLGTRRYPIPLGRLLNWEKVDLQCTPLQPGTKIEVWYKIDKATKGGANNDGWIQANMEIGNTGGGLQFQDKDMQNAIFYVGQKARVLEIMIKGLHSGSRTPEVLEANVYFSVG